MGKLQIGFILLLIAIIDINSLQALIENKTIETSIKSDKNISNSTVDDEVLSIELSDASYYSDETNEDDIQNCTCGIFLGGQITNNNLEPVGNPILSKEFDVVFQCTSLGIKKCQTKCVETIVKHLPKSNNILCASIDKDIHKEKAFLFVQNCDQKWYNTKLSAGKEFCCKDKVPYKCPLL